MATRDRTESAPASLRTLKLVHTVIWAFFAASILAILASSLVGNHHLAFLFIAIVFIEVLVLAVNRWRCPLTAVAARYTVDRRDNFDIYLPEWLARHNKRIFGVLYIVGIVLTVLRWVD